MKARAPLHANKTHTPVTRMRTPTAPLTDSARRQHVADAKAFRSVTFDSYSHIPDSQALGLSTSLGPGNHVNLDGGDA